MLLCGSYVTLKRVTFIPHCLQNVALCGIECYSNVAQMLLFLFAGLNNYFFIVNNYLINNK